MSIVLESAIRDWDFPRSAVGVVVLVDHCESHGLAARTALAGTGLGVRDLTDDAVVTAEQELRVVRNLLRSGSAAACSPVALGRRYRLASFGIAGYAMVSSRTLLEAMNFALAFLDLTYTFSIPYARVEGGQVVIEAYQDSLPADVRDFLVRRDLAAIEALLRELFLDTLPTRYDLDRGRITFPEGYLAAELPQASPAGRALAADLCSALAARRRDAGGLAQRVRILLTQRIAFDPTAGGVAAAMAVAERTLRRQLAAEGTSYQRLLDEVRVSLADRLLGTGTLTVTQVAQRLGYAEAASFIHAHRRWHGVTPTGRRRSVHSD